jgi:uncharacterized membrane protein
MADEKVIAFNWILPVARNGLLEKRAREIPRICLSFGFSRLLALIKSTELEYLISLVLGRGGAGARWR